MPASAASPSLIIADEPTSAFDMAVIAHLCDRVAVMQNGVFVETVTKEQILAGRVTHPYTKVLMDGSRGYTPKTPPGGRQPSVHMRG